MKPERKAFGFVIAGALFGAALGAAASDVMHRPLGVALGSFVGMVGGMAAERCYLDRLLGLDALLIGVIALILILLLFSGYEAPMPR